MSLQFIISILTSEINFSDLFKNMLILVYLDFDLWLTEEESNVYLQFQTVHFVKNFLVTSWIQSGGLNISLRSVGENTSINYIVDEHVSERYYRQFKLCKSEENIIFLHKYTL